jgi:hypothetical protein
MLFRCQTTNSPIRAWNIYESSPFSRKKFLSLCSIVNNTPRVLFWPIVLECTMRFWNKLHQVRSLPKECAYCVNVYYTKGHWFVEQEMPTIPEYMSSPPGFQWISRCSTCVMLCRSFFVLVVLCYYHTVFFFLTTHMLL